MSKKSRVRQELSQKDYDVIDELLVGGIDKSKKVKVKKKKVIDLQIEPVERHRNTKNGLYESSFE